MIQRPAEGTSVIPYAFGVGSTELPIDSLGAQNPVVFSDDEFTDFAYNNGFNSRNLQVQNLLNYYSDIDSFDEKVDFKVKDIKQSDAAFKDFFNNNEEYSHLIFEADEIKYRLASGSVGIQHATNEVIEKGELPMMIIVYAVIVVLVFVTYFDWRATICCTVPLTFATMLGYAFMD